MPHPTLADILKRREGEFTKSFIKDGDYEHPFFDKDSGLLIDLKSFNHQTIVEVLEGVREEIYNWVEEYNESRGHYPSMVALNNFVSSLLTNQINEINK